MAGIGRTRQSVNVKIVHDLVPFSVSIQLMGIGLISTGKFAFGVSKQKTGSKKRHPRIVGVKRLE
jgi:hypothetical protein